MKITVRFRVEGWPKVNRCLSCGLASADVLFYSFHRQTQFY